MITLAVYLTVGLSVFAHGLSAAPLARRYASWYEATGGREPRNGERLRRGDKAARTERARPSRSHNVRQRPRATEGVTSKTGKVKSQGPKAGKLLAPGSKVSVKLG